MYCDFFGLRCRPFEDRADTRLGKMEFASAIEVYTGYKGKLIEETAESRSARVAAIERMKDKYLFTRDGSNKITKGSGPHTISGGELTVRSVIPSFLRDPKECCVRINPPETGRIAPV